MIFTSMCYLNKTNIVLTVSAVRTFIIIIILKCSYYYDTIRKIELFDIQSGLIGVIS